METDSTGSSWLRMRRWAVVVGVLVAVLFGLTFLDDDPTTMLGVYTWGHEVNTWRSCGSAEVRWVQARARILDGLRDSHEGLTSQPYQGILVEAHLRHSGTEPDGFALNYDGLIRIDSVLAVRSHIPTNCRDTTWALPGRRPTYLPW